MAYRAASQRSKIEPFHVMKVIAAAAKRQETHGDVISLCAGQPSAGATSSVVEAAQRSLNNSPLGYTEAGGIRQLREKIAAHHQQRYGYEVAAEQVYVTTGSSGGFTALFLAALDPGDCVAMVRPGYPAYRNVLQSLGNPVVELACGVRTRFQPTLSMLQELDEIPAALIIASPSNPTGTIIDPRELAHIAAWCEENHCLLISDEIYHGISYGRETASAWSTHSSAVVVGSVSKYYAMTGWRLGWMLLPEWLVAPVDRLSGNLSICPPAIAQHAAIAAFNSASTRQLDELVEQYAINRDIMIQRLNDMGISDQAPSDGAFYVYANISSLTDDSVAWCSRLLDTTGVAITPGVDFDTVDGHQSIRLSFAGDRHDLSEAMDRLHSFVTSTEL